MTYNTHRAFMVWWVLVMNIIIYTRGLTAVDYYLSMLVMLQFGKLGALFPDIDHTWKNVKEKTVPNLIINKIIHLTGGTHRSWQTHSIDIVIIFSLLAFILPDYLCNIGLLDIVNSNILSIILLGFSSGWVSHIISDMLTSAGVRVLCFSKKKIALVPKQLFGLRFNTGDVWEDFVYKVTRIFNIVVGIYALIYPIINNETTILSNIFRW